MKPTSAPKWAHGAPCSPSQLSTAPCTPLTWPLGDKEGSALDDFVLCERDESFDDLLLPANSSSRLCTPLATQEEDGEEEDEGSRESVAFAGMMPLQSELARLAQAVVHAECWLQKQRKERGIITHQPRFVARGGRTRRRRLGRKGHPGRAAADNNALAPQCSVGVTCCGMPPLQSALATFAQAAVHAEKWLRTERRSKGLQPMQGAGDLVAPHPRLRRRRKTARRSMARRIARRIARGKCEEGDNNYNFGSVSDNDDLHSEVEVEVSSELVEALSVGLKPLQSQLGLWAERIVKADEWMQTQRRSYGLPELSLPLSHCIEPVQVLVAKSTGHPVRSRRRQRRRHLAAHSTSMAKEAALPLSHLDHQEPNEHETAVSVGMTPLRSQLAMKAQALLEAEEWLQAQRQQRGLLAPIQSQPSLIAPNICSRRRTLRRRAARRRAARRAAAALQEEEEDFGSVSDNDGAESEDGSEREASPELVGALGLGLLPMQSQLGLWAEKVVKADEWMQEQRRARGLPELCLPLALV